MLLKWLTIIVELNYSQFLFTLRNQTMKSSKIKKKNIFFLIFKFVDLKSKRTFLYFLFKKKRKEKKTEGIKFNFDKLSDEEITRDCFFVVFFSLIFFFYNKDYISYELTLRNRFKSLQSKTKK